jgi:DNA repair protein RecN (Recombination protein N)
MLRQLRVRDFALVNELVAEFEPGLTVITGESGAGKSLLVRSLGHVLGDRAAASDVRPGAERSDVTAELDLHGNEEALRLLASRELVDRDDPERCLLRRVMSADGRSRAYVNGTPVTRQDLMAIAAASIDIHGQNEHQALLRRDVQLALLDDHLGEPSLRDAVGAAYDAWQHAADAHAELEAKLKQSRDRVALLQYQVSELDSVAVTEGEFEELDARFRRLAKRQEIAALLQQATDALSGEDSNGADAIRHVAATLARITDDHAALSNARALLDTALTHLDEASIEIRRYADQLAAEPSSSGDIERRLDAIQTLARKHRVRPEELHRHHRELAAELGGLATDESSLTALAATVVEAREKYTSLSTRLSRARRDAAGPFAAAVSKLLDKLGIRHGKLTIEFAAAESRLGLESVEYWVTTNPKYPASPLTRIASGGERSRISLAIQVVAAERSRLPTLVLDEADVGIGGATADVVGRLLRKLATRTQVLCITHSPQVAALGEHHLRVAKNRAQDTTLEPLDRPARVRELARMLSGADVTSKTLEYAEELIASGAA